MKDSCESDNVHSWTSDKEWSCSLVGGRTAHCKTKTLWTFRFDHSWESV